MSVNFHFLNVGDGDTTIVDFPARNVVGTSQNYDPRVMMVDIHHHDDDESYEHIIDYYKRNFRDEKGQVRPIFRFVSSHPHQDHLKGLNELLEQIRILNFWDTTHNFVPDKTGFNWAAYEGDWKAYETVRRAGYSDIKVLRHTDVTTPAPFWNEDRIEVLSPSAELIRFVHYKEDGSLRDAAEIGAQLNNLSYVLLVKVNGLKILLAGDAEPKAWDYIIAHHGEQIKNVDILKAPHHGKDSAFHEGAVKLMNPKHIVLSASDDCENLVPEKYARAAPRATIYKTCETGTLVFQCGFDGTITVR